MIQGFQYKVLNKVLNKEITLEPLIRIKDFVYDKTLFLRLFPYFEGW